MVKLKARLKKAKRSLGREEVQIVSTGDSFKAFCYKEERSGSVGGGGHWMQEGILK